MGNYKLPIIYEGQEYYGIIKFNIYVIDLQFGDDNHDVIGGFYTSLPISPLSYRQLRLKPSPAKVRIESKIHYTIFHITDDWNKTYRIDIPNRFKNEIKYAILYAKQQELLK